MASMLMGTAPSQAQCSFLRVHCIGNVVVIVQKISEISNS
ncbi:hypothetical protein SynBIOSE41_01297 [Synechococcus sp. BIOS-E4-1]|nr:hypothetical protein SynBIOSE41_01297 [Synechococcus sp. BIOS-E4-1]